jgi:hypothetical protein
MLLLWALVSLVMLPLLPLLLVVSFFVGTTVIMCVDAG